VLDIEAAKHSVGKRGPGDALGRTHRVATKRGEDLAQHLGLATRVRHALELGLEHGAGDGPPERSQRVRLSQGILGTNGERLAVDHVVEGRLLTLVAVGPDPVFPQDPFDRRLASSCLDDADARRDLVRGGEATRNER
jgi:hypothetical protein